MIVYFYSETYMKKQDSFSNLDEIREYLGLNDTEWSLANLLGYRGTLNIDKLGESFLNGYSKNTVKSYISSFNKWIEFTKTHNLVIFPANIHEFKIFLLHRIEERVSFSTINNVICALKFFNKIMYVEDDEFEPSFILYLKKFAAKPDLKRRPLSKEEFFQILNCHLDYKNDLVLSRNLTIVIFGFLGFMRFDDFSQIRSVDLSISDGFVSIKIRNAKNDYLYSGQNAYFQLDNRCLKIVKEYVKLSKIFDKTEHDSFFFFHISESGRKFRYKPILYSSVRFLILEMCAKSNLNLYKIGSHSLRVGGCTAATQNGVPDHIIDAHGRWAPQSRARAGYQRVQKADHAFVSSKLLSS